MYTPIKFPELLNHVFWEQKEQFLFPKDIYLTWILFIIEEGKFTYRIDELEGQAVKGDVILCPPHIAFHRNIEQRLSFHVIAFDYPYPHLGLKPVKLHLPFPFDLRLTENLRQLRTNHTVFRTYQEVLEWKQHYFHDLWIIMKHYNLHTFPDPYPVFQSLFDEILSYIDEHANRPLEIKQVANHFKLTSVQLIRKFKNLYQITPLQYLTAVRIKTAAKYLLDTDWNLDEIAIECGYETGYYLSRVFYKHMGIRPSEYRKMYRV